jgi:hypothetical protein
MDTSEPQEISNPSDAPTAPTKSPTWPKVLFGIDIVILVLTSLMFVRILTGGWQESVTRNFGDDPAVLQSAYINAAITFVLVVIGIAADIFLLKLRRIGVILGLIALGLVLLAVAVQLWGAASARNPMAMSVQGPISVLRVLYNVIYLLALLRTKKYVA